MRPKAVASLALGLGQGRGWWNPSYCNTKRSCCYPIYGKPATDFGIHSLWPYFANGSYPQNCNKIHKSVFDEAKISELIGRMQKDWPSLSCPSTNGSKIWKHEWTTRGTCSVATLDQHSYFEAALNMKEKINILQILKNAGIKPGGVYSIFDINEAIRKVTGHEAGIHCNKDAFGKSQLYKVYICVDPSGSRVIECPGIPMGKCRSTIKFPSF
ncbi:ribonuclease 3-like [Olea europaea subsp. europaea]|uniref:Ribonuclease 3-like n=1 Tax=Olea europaea subsp. europaea TaxID=158383 RepID=A0A8S0QKI0_OLEEU|nr:ribonuclease 3-like [Olea europaea subsp. europaea]